MTIVTTVARISIGIAFTLAGASAFVFTTPPPLPRSAGVFIAVFDHSHWSLFLGAAQLAIGVLLLVNRYVPLALVMLAAFLYNSFAFHITMAPNALFAPLVVLALASVVAWPYRALFAQLFAARPETTGEQLPGRAADRVC